MSFVDWLAWATTREPTAFTGALETDPFLNDMYDSAVCELSGIQAYLNPCMYRLTIYNLAMFYTIVNSEYATAPRNTLYDTYSVASNTILVSATDSSSSSTNFIPNILQEGDAQTLLLWANPYGKYVESILEQLRDIPIVTSVCG